MYNYLKGILAEKLPTCVTIDVGGIGYEVVIPLSTFHKLPKPGAEVKLCIHHVVREDAQFLVGFQSEEERALFRLLISVTGIGPKLAVTILSGLGMAELKRAIGDGSAAALTSISGVGRKTAERLIVELREKIAADGSLADGAAIAHLKKQEAYVEDSFRALLSLGYSRLNAKTAIEKALANRRDGASDSETLVRESLKYM